MNVTIALAGQPNTGKSTLFNALTGSCQHVGNWPGKTVEQKTGQFSYNNQEFYLVDLPGAYSLNGNSPEEEITRDYLLEKKPDCVVVVADASQLERTLFMLAEVHQLPLRFVLVVTMMDIAARQGLDIAEKELEQKLNIPVVCLTATKGGGIDQFRKTVASTLKKEIPETEKCSFHPLTYSIAKQLGDLEFPIWHAGKLLEGDTDIFTRLEKRLSQERWEKVRQLLPSASDSMAETAKEKHRWIAGLLEDVICKKEKAAAKKDRRYRFDKLATHFFWGKVVAFFILLLALGLAIAAAFSAMYPLYSIMTRVGLWLHQYLQDLPEWLISLIADAFFPALCMSAMMFCFLVPLFFMIGTLEDIGYLARFSYIFDRMMNRMGLHGKSCISFLMSFACNMGGIASTRTIDSWRQRMITNILTSIVPCAAMWGVVGFVSILFFGKYALLVILALFLAMLVVLYLSSLLLRKFLPAKRTFGLIMEMPPYHQPNFKTISRYTWRFIRGFIKRGATLITAIFMLTWFLSYFPDGNIETSWLAELGRFMNPIGSLMGMDWQLMVALIASVASKEASLAVLAVVYGLGGDASSLNMLMLQQASVGQDFGGILLTSISPATALAFVFAMFFSIPCIGTLGTLYAETDSLKWTVIAACYYTITSFVMGVLAYQTGCLLF